MQLWYGYMMELLLLQNSIIKCHLVCLFTALYCKYCNDKFNQFVLVLAMSQDLIELNWILIKFIFIFLLYLSVI